MKKAVILLAAYALLGLSRADIAQAIILVDSGQPPAGGPMFNIQPSQFLAQQFTLPDDATITEIALALARIGSGSDPVVTVQLTNAIGPGTTAGALLFQATLTVSNPLGLAEN